MSQVETVVDFDAVLKIARRKVRAIFIKHGLSGSRKIGLQKELADLVVTSIVGGSEVLLKKEKK